MKEAVVATVILLALFSPYTLAQQQAEVCAPLSTVVYYGNGVGRGLPTLSDSMSGRNRLQISVMARVPTDRQDAYQFKLAFNFSRGSVNDIIEAAGQTLGREWPTLLLGILLNNRLIIALIPDSALQRMNDFLQNRAIQEMVTPNIAQTDLQRHVRGYKSDIGEGKKVVLVAHSQGNIFANRAFDSLTAQEASSFAIVPVASPESFVRQSFVGHIRFLDDFVIAGVEVAKRLVNLPAPLPPNDQDNIDQDASGHFFVDAYMSDVSAEQFIGNAVLTSETLVSPPIPTAGQGTITVTLTWGPQPDVDLHVFEPNNFHVYYARRTGFFGFLDVDDVTSFGPEHYFVSCQTLRDTPAAIGRYRVGVNYFSGSGSETANVNIKVPGVEFQASKLLPSARSTSGDNSPVPIADIVVTRNVVTGRFDFAVEPR